MQPIVSIIIPVYNASKTIEQCLKSILNQTLKEIEVIVINDCSTDDTLKKLEKYKNIILLNNESNLGPAGSRNRGLDIAKGKYIGFVDSDDYIEPNMYELMSSKMDEEVDLVACSRFNETKNGAKEIINKNTDTDAKAFSKTSNYITDKLFKRDLLEQYNLRLPKNYSYAEDFAFLIRYKFYANKLCILQEPLYHYLIDSEGSITNSYKRNLFNIINVLEEMLDFFRENDAFEKYESELVELSAGFYVRRTREFKNFNDKKLQREFVKEFLDYFKKNFKHYKHQINGFKTKYYRFYRSSYWMMLIYIELQQLRRKK